MKGIGVWVTAGLLASVGCGGSGGAKAPAAATVKNAVPEGQLATVTLSREAHTRLGIEVVEVGSGKLGATRTVGGEIIPPPGRAIVMAAPTAGTVLLPEDGALPRPGSRIAKGATMLRLLALPANQASVREVVDVAEARLRQAEAEARRVAQLFADRLLSERDNERAEADLSAARAAAEAARAQQGQVERGDVSNVAGLAPLKLAAPDAGVVGAVHVAAGQAVAAGTPLIELVTADRLWVRVPLYAGDARTIARSEAVTVSQLGTGAVGITAVPVRGPPAADPMEASIDLFYELRGSGPRPGERVNVALPLAGGTKAGVTVPLTAVVYDAAGGTWVYERLDSLSFARRRVDIVRIVEGVAALARGPAAGTFVVTAGVAELFGTEFGTGK